MIKLLGLLALYGCTCAAEPTGCIQFLTTLHQTVTAETGFNIPGTVVEIESEIERQSLVEKAVLKAAADEPTAFFLKVRKLGQQTRRRNGDFLYTIADPVIKRMILDLAKRLHEDLHPEDRRRFSQLIARGKGVLARGPRYRETFSFTFSYLDALDTGFLRLHPELSGRFHRTNAEPSLGHLLRKAPDLLMYPSYRPLGTRHFVKSRPSPFHVVGLHPEGLRAGEPIPFADGFYMKPSEFAWHDIGHVEFMDMRDALYLSETFKPIERVVQEWDLTGRRMVAFWDSFRSNKDVYDAIGMVLFEILHERGYQYSYAVLKAQLDTPKWTEILMRKLHNNYFQKFPNINFSLFDQLEVARVALLRFVDDSRRRDQLAHIAALYGEELAVRVTHFPKVDYGQGMFGQIEISDCKTVRVRIADRDPHLPLPDAENFVLAQVNPTATSPFTAEVRLKMNAVLAAKDGLGISHLLIGTDHQVRVAMRDGRIKALSDIVLSGNRPLPNEKLEERHFFELNQILGSQERGEVLSFTIHYPTAVYKGPVRRQLREGVESIIIVDQDQGEVMIPLAEALVDPLQRQDYP